MNIKIFIVANKLEKFILEGLKEYEKRLSRYCKIQFQLFKNEDQLYKRIPNKSYVIKLTTDGNILSSEELSEKINTLGISGKSDIIMLINISQIPVDETITISPMNMDVGIQTLLLFEQIYRAYRIIHNEPYHK
ncbi:23S rRNA (pseudouridine(1915)-N(3))-methyltransferase RlmH [Ureibacillus thermosphaericus]|uniref:23S rRNA (pseudouridine(1915)-N(3))-methyltransferase RlmH n=1 Tax=Ureibacillus thermosphaericus TaxID=51173 RepID=UPI000BBC31CE|nr:23S rRNA (pseudouridine(1915)-N(3))-methyltransferase RlmH [Ureibacillus thermosphaericus]